MRENLKKLIQKLPFLYRLSHNYLARRRGIAELKEWTRSGKPLPPPHFHKQLVLREYAKRFQLKVLVETGTFYGDMVETMRPFFNQIFSIELSDSLYEMAKQRFIGVKNIEIIHGDSSKELKGILNRLDQPALFWLDGHYSAGDTAQGLKDTPIYEELTQIFEAENHQHVIIIDDARCFGQDPAYPNIEELIEFVKSYRQEVDVIVKDDSIRITPL